MKAVTVAVLAIAVPLVLVAGAIWALASPAWLAIEYGRPGFPAPEGFTDAERLTLATTSTLFIVRPGVDANDLAALEREGTQLYTQPEIRHLQDVKALIAKVTVLGAGALAAIVVLGLWARPSAERARVWWLGLEMGGWLSVAMVLALGFLALVAWPFMFPFFHQVFFPPGTWQFEETSGLITLFPERFWFDSALALFGLIALGGASIAIGGHVLGRRRAGA